MAWDLISRVAWMQKPLGGLLEVSWGSFLASWGSPGAALGRSRGVLGRPWRRPGGLLELLKMLGRLRGCFQGLMEVTGEAFGRRWVPKWSPFGEPFGVMFIDLSGVFLRSLFELVLWLFWLHFGGQF